MFYFGECVVCGGGLFWMVKICLMIVGVDCSGVELIGVVDNCIMFLGYFICCYKLDEMM